MRPNTAPIARLLAAAAVALGCLAVGASATVVTTCRAAADSDARVDYSFCVAELGNHRESPDADTWGLAKVAALTGVNNADDAVYDAKALVAKQPGGPTRAAARPPDARKRAALGQCRRLYFDAELAFAGAYDEINAREYAAGKEMAAEAVALARRCDDVFAEAGIPSPLAWRGVYAARIGAVCTAIAGLINIK
ncbi:hypothetical protein HU200_043465 [Digitaria exilis]|uniref:Pectinesterase inhibitor domain-containing protein n=1 Tax=Digitaria exilis TaxID=1010633 RepID=A0A835B3Z9_9POAL|nr:hypothetical protein HU200_043465 [Digitaria exilis]